MVTYLLEKQQLSCPNPLKVTTDQNALSSIYMKGNTPLFMGKEYAGLSKEALYYIEDTKHVRAINAFSNATTNIQRLIPGFEAPVILAYSARNRSASCRIPVIMNPKAARMEIRSLMRLNYI